ncbi:MAG: N-acyl amino acid synthase FeeM domain-containing protein [Bacteroidota bacterium]
MKTNATIEYREAADRRELESLFELRYQVYKEDHSLKNMLSAKNHDFNVYDLNALHFGAFENGKPIACMRLAVEQETHQTSIIRDILEKAEVSLREKQFTFPFQHYHPDPRWSETFLRQLQDKRIGEVGRLAIHTAHRNGGQVLDDLFSAFISYCRDEHQVNTGFGSCTLLLERYYRKFGFRRAENCEPFVYKNLPEAVIVRFDDIKDES